MEKPVLHVQTTYGPTSRLLRTRRLCGAGYPSAYDLRLVDVPTAEQYHGARWTLCAKCFQVARAATK